MPSSGFKYAGESPSCLYKPGGAIASWNLVRVASCSPSSPLTCTQEALLTAPGITCTDDTYGCVLTGPDAHGTPMLFVAASATVHVCLFLAEVLLLDALTPKLFLPFVH